MFGGGGGGELISKVCCKQVSELHIECVTLFEINIASLKLMYSACAYTHTCTHARARARTRLCLVMRTCTHRGPHTPSHTSNLNIDSPVATFQAPGVAGSALGLVSSVSVYCD